jgi:ATP-binding cassette subfamily B protein
VRRRPRRFTADGAERLLGLRAFLDHTRWALRLAWDTGPGLALGLVVATLARATLPVGLALVLRGLFNTLAQHPGGAGSRQLGGWIVIGAGLAFAQIVCGLGSKYLGRRLQDELNIRINTDILAHAGRLDLATFEDPRFLDVLDRAHHNAAAHVMHVLTGGLAAAGNVLQLAAFVVVLTVIEPVILPVVVLVALPYLWVQGHLSRTAHARERDRTTRRRWTRYFVRCLTSAQGLAETRLLDLGPLLMERFRAIMAEFRDADRVLLRRRLLTGAAFALLSVGACLLLLWRVVDHVAAGTLSLGDLALFGAAALRVGTLIEDTTGSVAASLERALHVADLREFLSVQPRMDTAGTITPSAPRGEIALEDVWFTYPGQRTPALAGVTLHVRAGELVALVGENGAGKSTLAKLVARLYDPDRGRVLIDGVDARTLVLPDLYRLIAFVSQQPARYEASAGDNIAYGDWRRLLGDPGRVEEAARGAGVHDLLKSLPLGYDTMVGRMFGDQDLSGGQWQRIAIARALARDAVLLVLDEPTTGLDVRAESELFAGLRDLARGRTTLLISHRFTGAVAADRVVCLAEGRILDQGPHQVLLERCQHYADLYGLHQRLRAEPSS